MCKRVMDLIAQQSQEVDHQRPLSTVIVEGRAIGSTLMCRPAHLLATCRNRVARTGSRIRG